MTREDHHLTPIRQIGVLLAFATLLVLVPPVYGQPATPTPTPAGADASVTALADANVRKGNATTYAAVGFLLTGKSAPVIGIANRGSKWYYIELVDGTRGFIAPSVVKFTGDVKSLPPVEPPLLPTPAAGAPAVQRPVSGGAANLAITGWRLDPIAPVCNQTFSIFINVANIGTQRSAAGTITARDVSARTANTGGQVTGNFAEIDPGQNFVVVMPLTVVTYSNEAHRIVVTVDSNSQVTETNEADNITRIDYVLLKGECP